MASGSDEWLKEDFNPSPGSGEGQDEGRFDLHRIPVSPVIGAGSVIRDSIGSVEIPGNLPLPVGEERSEGEVFPPSSASLR